jgi:lysophospholipase L1-like esterase
MTRATTGAAMLLVVAVLTSGCGGPDSTATTGAPASEATTTSGVASATATITPTPTPTPTPTSSQPAPSTPKLDSVVVLGHSGTTGYDSDPSTPDSDARANSWATGSNPQVDSIYQRLLATHPALKGHAVSEGVDGASVDQIPDQVEAMLQRRPLPDVVIIQVIDNDIQCDGTDPANEKTFATKLSRVLDTINEKDRYAQIFLIDQATSVQTYADVARHLPAAMSGNSGSGPCAFFTAAGNEIPAGIARLQKIVDDYYAQITRVCAAHPRCFTDHAHLQQMPLSNEDLASDSNHLSVKGLALMAQYAWDALPDAIKNRP